MEDAYDLKWDDLGDIEAGRPNLGGVTSVVVYRLMQYTFKMANGVGPKAPIKTGKG